MQRITISRFTGDIAKNSSCILTDDDGVDHVEAIEDHYSAVVEGVRDDGSGWVMFIDADGCPELFWSERGPDRVVDGAVVGGGVIGDPIVLNSAIGSVTVETTYELCES